MPAQKNNDAGRTRRYLIKAAMMGGVLRLSFGFRLQS